MVLFSNTCLDQSESSFKLTVQLLSYQDCSLEKNSFMFVTIYTFLLLYARLSVNEYIVYFRNGNSHPAILFQFIYAYSSFLPCSVSAHLILLLRAKKLFLILQYASLYNYKWCSLSALPLTKYTVDIYIELQKQQIELKYSNSM